MQCVPYITYTAIITLFGVEMGTPTTLLPLGFVVTVDAIFQALEDTTRHNADYEANNSPTRLVDPTSGAVVDAPWRDVRVGDLVVVRNRGGTRERHSQLQRLPSTTPRRPRRRRRTRRRGTTGHAPVALAGVPRVASGPGP